MSYLNTDAVSASELIDKREKYIQLQRAQEMEEQKRKNAITSMDVVLVEQRTKLQKTTEHQGSLVLENGDSMLLKKYDESLELALANDHDGQLDEKWPHLILRKVQAILQEAASAHGVCEKLERIVENYKHNLHVYIDENSELFYDAMQHENEESLPAPDAMQHETDKSFVAGDPGTKRVHFALRPSILP